MCNHCVPMVCHECGEEYCVRCQAGECPKCGTPWNQPVRKLTAWDFIKRKNSEIDNEEEYMENSEEFNSVERIYRSAFPLSKKDKIQLVNKILQSIAEIRAEGNEDLVMPVWQGLRVYRKVYRERKGVEYTTGQIKGPDFKAMKTLLTKLEGRLVESGCMMIDDSIRLTTLERFLNAVATMPNKWYFNNRFKPQALAMDFETIYSNLKQNNNGERAKRAYDYL